MFNRLLVFIALLCTPFLAQAQATFLFGVGTGMVLGSGESAYGGSGATVLYAATNEYLSTVDIRLVRMVSDKGCFNRKKWAGASFGKMFERALDETDVEAKESIVLQIVRTFDLKNPVCATIWFTYITKEE